MILVSKKDLLQQIALNTAIKENTEAVIANATAKASVSQTVAILTAEQQKELINHGLLKKEQLEQIATELGLQGAQNGTLVSTKALNTERLKEILTSQGIQKEIQEEILQKISLTSTNKSLSQSTVSMSSMFKGLGTNLKNTFNSIKTFLTSPLGVITAIISGMVILNQLRELFTTSPEEQIEKTKELESEYEELTSDVNALNSELETTKNRIEELQGKDSLSFVEEEELERLRAENKELELQKTLLQEKADLQKEEVNKAIRDEYAFKGAKHLNEIERSWLPETTDEDLKKIEELDKKIEELNHEYYYGDYDPSNEDDAKILDNLERQANKLQKERDILAAKSGSDIVGDYVNNDQYVALMTKSYRDLYSKYLENPESFVDEFGNETDDKKKMDEIRKALVDKATELNEDIERYGVDDEFSKGLKDLSLEISYALYPGEFNSELFEKEYDKLLPSVKEELEQIVGRNELTSETLVNFFSQESIDTLSEYGITVEDIIDQLHNYINVTKDAGESTKNFIGVLSKVQGLDSGMELLGNVYKDVKDGDTFDYSSILNNEDFDKTFSKYGEEYTNFIKTITTTPSDIDKCQTAFNDLATAYIYGSGVMENLTSETKNQTITMLEQMGVTNALALVEEQIIINEEELALRKKFLAEYGHDLKYATEEETVAFLNQTGVIDGVKLALFNYQVQETIFNNSSLDVSGRMSKLVELAAMYGVCTELVEDFNKKQELAQKGVPIGTNYSNADFNSMYEKAQEEIYAKYATNTAKINFAPKDDKEDKSSESAKDILDKYFDYYEKQLQAGQITYKEYVQKCNDIRDKYYNDGKITSAEYYQYLADLYEKELEYHDKTIYAVTDAIDDKIDELEKQKEELEDYYNGLIENIQSEIDGLQKANEERERAIALQKAQYELNRALNQRIDYVYQDGQFIYKARDGAIRDAQNELDDQLFDMRIKDLENQIEDLEKALEDATETIDEQINALNEYRDKWSSISDEYEKAQNRIYAASILGADWEADVLNGRLDKLENFKNEYLRIQGELAKASMLGADPGATSTTGGSGGDSGGSGNIKPTTPTPDTSSTSKSNNAITGAISGVTNALTPGWYVVDKDGNPILSSRCNSQGEATSKIGFYPNGRKVKKYHSGLEEGRVSKYRKLSDDEIVKMFQSFGNGLLKPDEVPAILKAGELVMTQGQQSNIARNMQMIYQNKTPIIPPANDMRKSQAIVEQHIDIHCPNVTNESGANYIKRELTSLTTKALQFDWNA